MHRVPRDQRGQSLVIVLSLITLFFLLGSALAVHASVALRATRASEGQGDDFYAADAATELGIWWQRNGRAGNPPAQTINGITTSTTITTQAGAGGSCPAGNTPIWMSGFESGVIPSAVISGGQAPQGSAATPSTSVVRTGAYSARISPAGGGATVEPGPGVPLGQVTVLHAAFQFAALPATDATVMQIWSNGNQYAIATLYYKASSGKWTMALNHSSTWSDRTEIQGSVSAVAGQWHTFDIRFQNYVNPVVVDWYVDGVAQPQHTRVPGGSTTSTLVRFGQASLTTTATYTGYFDDIMISKTSSDFPLPDIRIKALKPNGMGTHNTPGNYQQTVGATGNDPPIGGTSSAIAATSWQLLDEIPMTTSDDFIKEITAGSTTYIEIAFEDTTETCLRGASLYAGIQTGASQAMNLAINGVTNGFDYRIFSGQPGSTLYRYVQGMLSQNASVPGTGPWTQAIVNGIVARFGMSTDASPNPYLQAIILEYAYMNVVASPATLTIVGTAGGSTVSTSYTDAGAGIPSLTTWTTTK
jgi:Tfp pilus assembly protein PilX